MLGSLGRLVKRAIQGGIEKPVFIIGCGRSGTTLLFQLVRQHPGLCATTGYPDGEDHVGWNEHGGCYISGLGRIEREGGHTGYHYCLHMDENDVDEATVQSMHRFYREDVLGGDRKRRVLNKCGHLSNKLRYVRRIFPDAKFVHIVRDCLPVVASWVVIMQQQKEQVLYWPDSPYPCFWVMPAPKGPGREAVFAREDRIYPGGGILRLVDYWTETNRNIPKQLEDRPDQLLTLKYEDLCADPKKTLARIWDFCELPQADFAPKDASGQDVNRTFHTKYLEVLTEQQIREFNERARDVRAMFGYR